MSYASEILADSPKAYYRMRETSGLIQDSSTLAHHATSVSGTQTFSYGVGSPISSDASDRSIGWAAGQGGFVVPDHADLDHGDTLTVEAWIFRSDLGVTRVITAKGVNALTWGVDAATNNVFAAKANVGTICLSTVTVALDTWTHVAYTKATTTSKIYINGVDRTGTVTNQTLSSTATDLRVGCDYTDTLAWYGALDEVALYSTALSQARIQAHYAAATGVGVGTVRPRVTSSPNRW